MKKLLIIFVLICFGCASEKEDIERNQLDIQKIKSQICDINDRLNSIDFLLKEIKKNKILYNKKEEKWDSRKYIGKYKFQAYIYRTDFGLKFFGYDIFTHVDGKETYWDGEKLDLHNETFPHIKKFAKPKKVIVTIKVVE